MCLALRRSTIKGIVINSTNFLIKIHYTVYQCIIQSYAVGQPGWVSTCHSMRFIRNDIRNLVKHGVISGGTLIFSSIVTNGGW